MMKLMNKSRKKVPDAAPSVDMLDFPTILYHSPKHNGFSDRFKAFVDGGMDAECNDLFHSLDHVSHYIMDCFKPRINTVIDSEYVCSELDAAERMKALRLLEVRRDELVYYLSNRLEQLKKERDENNKRILVLTKEMDKGV